MSNIFDNLSPDEQKLLNAYDNFLSSGEMTRTNDEKTFDKLYLLGIARLRVNTTYRNKKIDKEFIEKQLQDLKKTPPDYNETGEQSPLNKLITRLYNAKKFANYDRSAYGMFTTNDSNGYLTAKGSDFVNYLEKDNFQEKINIINEKSSGWIFRTPKNFIKGKMDHRYALNVIPDKELIRKLDEFTAKHKMHYKTCRPRNWYNRNDSVVIYCPNAQTAEEIAELKQLAAPYIRRDNPSRLNDLDGTFLADGIVTAKEVDRQQCMELYDKLKTVNPLIAQNFMETFDNQSSDNKENPLSLGQFKNYANLLDTFIAERNKAPQQQTYLSTQDRVTAAIDDLAAKQKVTPRPFGPSATQKAQEHMRSNTQGHPLGHGQPQSVASPSPQKNNWKTKLKKLASATLQFAKETTKEILLSPYLIAKEIHNLPQRLARQSPKKTDWRKDPQRMAQVSIRFNRMLNHQKTSQQSHKDMAQFIKNMRNGNNAALQQKPLAASAQTIENQPSDKSQNQPSLSELMEKGIDVSLSEKSRLSFAPDIENLRVSKDKHGVLHMHGISKDGKQSIDFSAKDGNIQFEMKDEEVARAYNNKLAGKWTWRNLKSPSGTRHFDQNGEKYAKEMAAVMDKIKAQYQTKAQQNAHISDMGIAKDGGR